MFHFEVHSLRKMDITLNKKTFCELVFDKKYNKIEYHFEKEHDWKED